MFFVCCETQLALLVHELHVNLHRNIQTDATFLDYAEAFHAVPQVRLLLMLVQPNFDPNVLA